MPKTPGNRAKLDEAGEGARSVPHLARSDTVPPADEVPNRPHVLCRCDGGAACARRGLCRAVPAMEFPRNALLRDLRERLRIRRRHLRRLAGRARRREDRAGARDPRHGRHRPCPAEHHAREPVLRAGGQCRSLGRPRILDPVRPRYPADQHHCDKRHGKHQLQPHHARRAAPPAAASFSPTPSPGRSPSGWARCWSSSSPGSGPAHCDIDPFAVRHRPRDLLSVRMPERSV